MNPLDETLPPTHARSAREPADALPTPPLAHGSTVPDTLPVELDAGLNRRDHAATVGQRFGNYELLEPLGKGGMGVVFKARQLGLNRIVALKRIRSAQFAGDDEIQRFYAEAEAAAALDHSGIVPIYEVGQVGGEPFFSMGYIPGESLHERLAAGPLAPRIAAQIVQQVAEAVEYAHQRGIIHRDLKPANILLDGDGHPRVTDFGLAKRTAEYSGLTMTGQVLGTPAYMPPEQARSQHEQVGPRSDVYSLGAVLYALLTGRPPFQAASGGEIFRQLLHDEPLAPRKLNPSIPADLETIAVKCLDKDPSRRYRTAATLAADLHRFLNHEPVTARPISRAARVLRWCQRKPLAASLLTLATVLVLLLTVGGPLIAYRESRHARDLTSALKTANDETTRANQATTKAKQATKSAQQAAADAQRQLRIAIAQRLATESNQTRSQFPVRSTLLALEAISATRNHGELPIAAGANALRDSLNNLGGHLLDADGADTCAISSDGRWLVAGIRDGTVRVWDLSAVGPAAQVKVLRGHKNPIVSVAFSGDGRSLVTESRDYTIRVRGGERYQETESYTVCVWEMSAEGPSDHVKVLRVDLDDTMSLAFSQDRRWFVTGSRDGTIRLWDLWTSDPAAQVRVLAAPKGRISHLEFSQDGRRLVAGIGDGTIGVWDVRAEGSSAEVKLLRLNERSPRHLKLSPDGRWLVAGSVAGSRNGTVRVWDLSTKDPSAQVRVLRGHEDVIDCLAFSHDGRWLITGSWDHTARIWDLGAPHPSAHVKVLRGHRDFILNLTLSQDGRWLITESRDNTARIWDLSASDPSAQVKLLAGHEDTIRCRAFSPDGRWLVTGSWEHTARLWDLNAEGSSAAVKVLRGHEGSIQQLALSPCGRWLVTVGLEGKARVWDLSANGPSTQVMLGHEGTPWHPALSQDGRRLVTDRGFTADVIGPPLPGRAAAPEDWLNLWDLNAPDPSTQVEKLREHEGSIGCFTLSQDGRWLVTASTDHTARVWDLSGQDPAAQVQVLRGHEGDIHCLALSQDGRWLVTGSRDRTARVWDLSAKDPSSQVKVLRGHGGSIDCLALSEDGRWLATGSDDIKDPDYTPRVWDLSMPDPSTQVKVLRGHVERILHLAVNHDGRWLVTASMDGTCRVWDLNAEDPSAHVKVLEEHVNCLALSQDGRRLFAGRGDGPALVWDLSAEDPAAHVKVLRGHEVSISCLALSQDERWLVTGSEDHTARVWDLSAQDPSAQVQVLRGHEGAIWSLALSQNGRWLVTGSEDSTARVWDLNLESLMYLARRAAGRSLTTAERELHDLPTHAPVLDALPVPELAPWQHPRILHQDPKWHDRQAEECRRIRHQFGVEFHQKWAAKLRAEGVNAEGLILY